MAASQARAHSVGSVGQKSDLAAALERQERVEAADKRLANEVIIRGDNPLFLKWGTGDFIVLRMNDPMIIGWIQARRQGCGGWWWDSTSGLVGAGHGMSATAGHASLTLMGVGVCRCWMSTTRRC